MRHILLFIILTVGLAAQDSKSPTETKDSVLLIKLHTAFNKDLLPFTRRAFKKVSETPSIKAVIIDLHTSGNDLNTFKDAVDILNRCSVPVYMFINSSAVGSGSLLSFATKGVYVSEDAVIGSANMVYPKDTSDEIKEQTLSILKAELRHLCRKNNHSIKLAYAMVDKDIEYRLDNGRLISKKGSVLTLTADEAIYGSGNDRLLARKIVKSHNDIIKELGLDDHELITLSKESDVKLLENTSPPESQPVVDENGKVIKQQTTKKIEKDTPFTDSPDPKLTGKNDEVVVLKFHHDFNETILYTVRRVFKEVNENGNVRAVIIDMKTPGGRVDVMMETMGIIHSSKVPVYLYVNQHAYSAGALASFACDGVYMSDDGAIGAAAIIVSSPEGPQSLPGEIKEKFNSATRAKIKSYAELNGYRAGVAYAMMDQDYEYKIEGEMISPSGSLLTLSAKDAARIMPDGKPLHAHGIVKSLDELIELKGLQSATIVHAELTQGEKLARIITALAPILLLLGFLGIYIEMNTPGFGFPGLVGLACLGIAFFGHHIAGTANAIELLIVVVGIVLLAVEIFVIPGFGIFGALGLAAIGTGFVMMMIPHLPDVPDPSINSGVLQSYLMWALMKLAIAMVGGLAGIFILNKYLPNTGVYSRLVLQTSLSTKEGYSGTDEAKNKYLEGKEGVAQTVLRPSGIATIEGKRVDVVCPGSYVDKGDRIRVTKVEGARIVVAKIDKDTSDEKSEGEKQEK